MAGRRRPATATWFGEHSGLALFGVGCVLVLAAVVTPDRGAATTAAILFIGGGMVLVGALLPRLAGTIRITPASIEMALAERLDATRREAEVRTPGHQEEAIGRAFEALLPRLRAAGVVVAADDDAPVTAGDGPSHLPDAPPQPAAAHPSASEPRSTRAMRAWPRLGWAAAGIGVATLVLVALMPLELLVPDGGLPEPPPEATDGVLVEPPPEPSRGVDTTVVVAVVALAAAVAAAAWVAWRPVRSRLAHASQKAVTPPFLEPPRVFARRIVDGLATEVHDLEGPEPG